MESWNIRVTSYDPGRRVALLEGRARPAGAVAEDELEFSLTFYSDQVSLNLPATTAGREFINRLTQILGPPRLEPTVKCSCSWGDGVMGAMCLVLWDLPQEADSPRLQELHAFLHTPLGQP